MVFLLLNHLLYSLNIDGRDVGEWLIKDAETRLCVKDEEQLYKPCFTA